jgi:hypothetical protein
MAADDQIDETPDEESTPDGSFDAHALRQKGPTTSAIKDKGLPGSSSPDPTAIKEHGL